MAFLIKAAISDLHAKTFEFTSQKTMYGGKQIAADDVIFQRRGIARQTPRVSITVRRTSLAKRPLGRRELESFEDWNDGQPATELNFKFYRQATNKIGGISAAAAAFLDGFF